MNSRVAPFDALPLLGGRALPGPDDADSVDVRALARVFWRRRWFVAVWAVGLGLLAYLIVSQMAPTYTATAKVILDTRKAQIVTGSEVMADLQPSEQIVNGEISVIRSNLLLGDVVNSLGPEALRPLDSAERAPAPMARLADALRAALGLGSPGAPDTAGSAPAGETVAALLSPEERRLQRLIAAIRRSLTVYNEADSYVIVIRVDTIGPELAMVLANTIAERYIELQLDARRDTVHQATRWLEERVAELRADLEEKEAAVARFQAESLLRDGGTIDNTSQQLAELSTKLAEARAARLEAEARHTELAALIREKGLEAAAATVSSPTIETLRARLLQLRQEDAIWAASFPPDHPRRVEIARAMNQLTAEIGGEIGNLLSARESEVNVARIRENSLQDSVRRLEERVMQITGSRLGLRQLEREASAARATYESLLVRLTESRTQRQLQQPDAKMIEEATLPVVPTSPRPKLMGALAFSMGALGAVGWVFFTELTSVTFRTGRELKAATGRPVLANLPLGSWRTIRKGLKEIQKNPYGPYAEQVRQLRTILLTAGDAERPRSAMLLSSLPGEGKTMTTLALATMAAMAGRRVVVVDTDLRRAAVRKALGLKFRADFADFVEGRRTLGETVTRCPEFGFDVIGSAGGRQAATEEFSPSWLMPMVADLKEVYDLVLIDAPALLAVSDALILAPLVDHRFYVVGWDSTPRTAVLDGLSRLRDLRITVDGLMFNKIDASRSPDPYGAYVAGYADGA